MDKRKLKRNIRLYGFMKIFTKRVFLPITTVYLVTIAHLTIPQIGLLATISAVLSLISEVPTGFLADKLSRKSALICAGSFAGSASLIYALAPSFPGAVLAVILESIGYAFLNGPAEALIHDTLVEMDQVDNYAKVAGRAQSFGLIGNTVLVTLTPLLYPISPKLPFLCGTLAYLGLILIAHSYYEVPRHQPKHHNPVKELLSSLRKFVTRYSIWIFIAIGLISALNNTSGDFTNLILKDQHLNIKFFGLVYGISSIVGITVGYFVHLLRNLSLRTYAIIDVLVFGVTTIMIGGFHRLDMAVAGFVLSMGWWRLRNIVYQHQLLKIFKHSHYKATLVSVYAFFIRCNEVWMPFLFVASTKLYGLYTTYRLIGIFSMVILIPVFILATSLSSKWELQTT